MMPMLAAAIEEHLGVFRRLHELAAPIDDAAQRMADCIAAGGKLLFCGNGGSAADCQHIAAELVGRFVKERPALPAVSLTVDTSALTCIGNDYGFEHVFARQVKALGKPGDVLVAVSTSGNSANVLQAVQAARETGLYSVGLSGRDGGSLRKAADICIVVPSDTTARIQEAHIFIGHYLCGQIEQRLGLV